MNNYEIEAIGDIIIVKELIFLNTATEKKVPDHAWFLGRPCLIIYSDNEYDYILTLTSTPVQSSNTEKQYFKLNEDNILHRCSRKNKINKEIKGSVNLESIYKMPISGHDKVGKIDFETYKEITTRMKEYYQNPNIAEILKNKATNIRR